MKTYRSERGQAIILILIAMVAMLGFVALAVDGGRVFSERRRLQSAADAAAYAAASAVAHDEDPISAALAQAALNDVVDASGEVNAGQDIDVIVNHPPQQGEYVGDDEYYEVVVRAKVAPSFTGVVKAKADMVEAYAVSHVVAEQTAAGDAAVMALTTSGEGLTIGASGTTTTVNLKGGDLFANANAKKNNKTSKVTVTEGIVKVGGSWTDASNVSPAPKNKQTAYTVPDIPEPLCPSTQRSYNPNVTNMQPGFYAHEVWINTNKNFKFAPGIYCFYNGLVIPGGSSAKLTGKGVLIVMLNGEIRLDGTGKVNLTRANSLKDERGNEYGGMLMYVTKGASVLPYGTTSLPGGGSSGATCGASSTTALDAFINPLFGNLLKKDTGCPKQSKDVYLSGSSSSTYSGTIYNPDHQCTVEGASSVTVNGTVICKNVILKGTTVTINHNPAQNYRLPPLVELSE